MKLSTFSDIKYHQIVVSNITSFGEAYSWTNGTVSSHIDRALVNHLWSDLLQSGFALFSDIVSISDHGSIMISTSSRSSLLSKGFKFCNELALLPTFMPLIEDLWINHSFHGCKAFVVSKLLKRLKGPLRTLFKAHCSGLSNQVHDAEKSYKQSLRCLQHDPLNQILL